MIEGSGSDRPSGASGGLRHSQGPDPGFQGPVPRSVTVARCPACGYHGEGIPYFQRPSHFLLLVGATVFTYGVGGLAYWLLKRRSRICPGCGLDWERASRARQVLHEGPDTRPAPLPSAGGARRVGGAALVVTAVFLALLGLSEAEALLLALGGGLAGAGALTFWWGWSSKQARREELMARLQRRVLDLAARRGGELTVTTVAHELDLSLPAAERILESMEDGLRVRSHVTDDGLIVFEFPELPAPPSGGDTGARSVPDTRPGPEHSVGGER